MLAIRIVPLPGEDRGVESLASYYTICFGLVGHSVMDHA